MNKRREASTTRGISCTELQRMIEESPSPYSTTLPPTPRPGPPLGPQQQQRLRALSCSDPAVLTFRNSLSDVALKIYWMYVQLVYNRYNAPTYHPSQLTPTHDHYPPHNRNYDGDEELFALIPPENEFTIDAFESHPFRVYTARDPQALVVQHIATKGEQLINIDTTYSTSTVSSTSSTNSSFEGFDGVGGSRSAYSTAEVSEIALDHLGGVMLFTVDGFPSPIPVPVAGLEAAELFHSTALGFRRPTTVSTWTRSLQTSGVSIERCLLTRVVGTTYYSRIVLRSGSGGGGEGGLLSIDSRPSDAVAVALASGAPIYVSKRIASAQQPGSGSSVERVPGGKYDMEPPVGRMPQGGGSSGSGGDIRTSGRASL